ncbi:MAG: hypothetical protein Q4E02_00230 [Lagierella massiliensis]|nr:hypothetical protein [Lagierella massiliensis]
MDIFKIELRRAFKNKKFLIALAIGLLLAGYNFITNMGLTDFYKFSVEYEKYHMLTPGGLFTNNILSSPLELDRTLFFYSVVILGALPFADSYVEDKVMGFNKNILSRASRKKYYTAKWLSVFISGFAICVLIAVFNFMLNMTIIPMLHPIIEGLGNSYGQDSSRFLVKIFVSHPILHFILFSILLGMYVGVLSTFGLLTSIFSENRFVAILMPFLLTQVMGIIQSVFRISRFYLPNDINTGNGQIDLKIAIAQIIIMGMVSFVLYVVVENKRSHKIGI